MTEKKIRERLCKPCSKCKKKFQPTGKYEKLCERCKMNGYAYTKQKYKKVEKLIIEKNG